MIFRHRRGVVLIIVMIVASGLSILAFGLAFRARVRIKTFGLNIQNVQAYHLAMGGIEKGKVFLVEEVLSGGPDDFDLNVAKSVPFAAKLSQDEKPLLSEAMEIKQELEYAVFDESSFMNINKTSYVNMMKLSQIDEALACKILDWKDQDEDLTIAESAETDYYIEQSPPYLAKNEEFTNLRELLFLKDVEVADYLGMLLDTESNGKFNFFDGNSGDFPLGLVNLFSVHGDGQFNINTTPAVMLASMTDFDLSEAEVLVGYRNSLASDVYISDDAFLSDIGLDDKKTSFNQYCCYSSNVFRIYSYGEVGESYCCFMAVVKCEENKLKTLSLERIF